MFALLVVTLLIEKMFAKKNLEKWFLQFSKFLLSCCDVLNFLFLIQQIGEDILPFSFAKFSKKDVPFFLLFPLSSIQSKHFLRTKRLLVCFISFLFSEKIFVF